MSLLEEVDLSRVDTHCAYIAIDIGGTNCRVTLGTMARHALVARFGASSKPELLEGLGRVARALQSRCETLYVHGACVALAGPIVDGGQACRITNYGGDDTRIEVGDFPAALAPRGRTILLNDLEATGYGICALEHPSSPMKLADYYEAVWGDEPRAGLHHDGKYCVLAVGTGLGGGAILYNSAAQSFSVLPLEPGHQLVHTLGASDPDHVEERKLFEALAGEAWDNQYPPEYELFASGRGLEGLYRYAGGEAGVSAARVARMALDGDAVAGKALELHYRYLARCAGSMCTGMLLKAGVFWAGDNGVANFAWIKKNAALLREEFLRHPKADWIRDTPLYAQTKELNCNLLGALSQAEIEFR